MVKECDPLMICAIDTGDLKLIRATIISLSASEGHPDNDRVLFDNEKWSRVVLRLIVKKLGLVVGAKKPAQPCSYVFSSNKNGQ